MVGAHPNPGEVILAVRAVGKHLLVDFSGGLTLDTHMRMTGSWHLYRTGETWRKPRHLARVILEVDGWVGVCFSAPVVRTFATAAPTTPIDHLGPDLTAEHPDIDECVARLGWFEDRLLADVLLDQRVANGVGNVYKSEVCWTCRLHPGAVVGALSVADRHDLVVTAARLLRANLGGGPRRTFGQGLAVYGRAGRACPRDGAPVRRAMLGETPRVTYWCDRCQRRPT